MVGSLLPQARRLGRLPTTIILLSLTATTIGCCGAQHSAGDFLYKDGATRDGGVDHSNGPTLIYNTAAFGKGLRLVDEGAGVEQLAVTENDVQYLGLTCAAGEDECPVFSTRDSGYSGDIYFATSAGEVISASSTSMESPQWTITTVIRGRVVTVRVMGYNLGVNMDDIIMLSIRGVQCTNLRRESSNSLLCVSGHPTLSVDGGKGITVDDIIVKTKIGGWTGGGYPGDFVDSTLADHSLKPIMTDVRSRSREVSPHALAFDHAKGHLYFADFNARSIERVKIVRSVDRKGGLTVDAVVEWDTFLPDVGLVYGMALDPHEGRNGGFLYFSDAQSGTISRIELSSSFSPDGKQASDSVRIPPETLSARREVIMTGLVDPRGVALEPNNGTRLFYTLYGGSINAVARSGVDYVGGRRSVGLLTGGGEAGVSSPSASAYEVRRFDSGTRLDGIAIAESEKRGEEAEDPTERRLYWSEHGRRPALKRSTLDGTRVETLSLLDNSAIGKYGTGISSHGSIGDNYLNLVWPRALAFGTGANSPGLIYSEHLGAIRRLSNKAGGVVPETVAEDDSYPAAVAVRTLIWRAGNGGLTDKYFTETLR